MMTVGNGEMIDNQAQTELLPPTSSYLRQRLSLQKGNFGYSSPLYLSAVPNTESGTMIKPLLYQWPSKICSPRENAQQMQPTGIDPKKLLHPPRSRSPGSLKVQQHKVMADEAHKALHVVIGYCKQQSTGFLDFQESVVLGKLDERLRCCSN
jgi:hypothetical protein